MKIIEPKVELINSPAYFDLLSLTELAGRTCYKSEAKISEGSACLLYTSPSPRDGLLSRMPSSA